MTLGSHFHCHVGSGIDNGWNERYFNYCMDDKFSIEINVLARQQLWDEWMDEWTDGWMTDCKGMVGWTWEIRKERKINSKQNPNTEQYRRHNSDKRFSFSFEKYFTFFINNLFSVLPHMHTYTEGKAPVVFHFQYFVFLHFSSFSPFTTWLIDCPPSISQSFLCRSTKYTFSDKKSIFIMFRNFSLFNFPWISYNFRIRKICFVL